MNTNGEKVKEQHGVVRNNCIDCLDRTNATQVIYLFIFTDPAIHMCARTLMSILFVLGRCFVFVSLLLLQ